MLLPIRITGLLAIFGALLYAISDVLLLASKANLDGFSRLKPYAKLLSDAEKKDCSSAEENILGCAARSIRHTAGDFGILPDLLWVTRRKLTSCAADCLVVQQRVRDWRICSWDFLLHG